MNSQPTQSFVPLTAAPAAPTAREFRVSVLHANGGNGNGEHKHSGNGSNGHHHGNGHANGNGNGSTNGNGAEKKSEFQSLEMLRPAALGGAEKKPCEPRVTVQRDGDRVTHLRIQCTCGQIMDLACVYEETPTDRK
jgi:hypothetical protein